MTGEANTWVAGGAGNWGDDANWSLGHVPTNTETAVFDNTSDNNCAVNAAPDLYGINLATGYDGTVTQGAVDIALGAGGYTQAAGTFTGNVGKSLICAGSFARSDGTMTVSVINLVMTGAGSSVNYGTFNNLQVSANITASGTVGTWGTVTIDAGRTLTIANTKTFYIYSGALANSGIIKGEGTLATYQFENLTLTFGVVNCAVIAQLKSGWPAITQTLGANTVLGSTLTVQSLDATNTYTLDMAGKTLSATAITVGARGILTNSGAAAACTTPGAFTISGASAVVSGAIALDCGSYVQSDGTFTQVEDITIGAGGYSQAAGTATFNVAKTVTCGGSFTKTGGTVTANKLNLNLYGDLTSNSAVVAYSVTLHDSTLNVVLSSYRHYTTYGTVTIESGKSIRLESDNDFGTTTNVFRNYGTINGPGKVYLVSRGNPMEFYPGTINTDLLFSQINTETTDNFTVMEDGLLGNVEIKSDHATELCVVDINGKTLAATAITVSTRGVLTNSGAEAACTTTGAFTVSGASAVVSGAIVLTYGTYVQSNGTATQVGNWSGGAVTASGGTLVGAGSASVTLTSSGDVNLTGATVTADKLNLVMTGAGKTLTTTATLFGLKASAYTNIAASCAITAGAGSHLTTDAGAFLNIANTKVLTLPLYADGATLVPNGPIGGLGTLAITMSDGDVSTRLGTILCPMTIASINTAAANRVLTVLDDPSLAAVTVSSSDDDKTTTLDFAGRSANISGAVTIGTRGVLLGGEGVHHLGGNFDSSAGTWTPETCQVVFTKAATITCAAASKTFYDLIGYSAPITLGADAVVSNIFAHVGPIVKGAFALTMTDPQKEFTGMRRPVLRNLRTPIGLPPCCRPLLDGIERVVQ